MAAAALVPLPPAAPSAQPRSAAPLIDQLIACRGTADQARRLACFDQAAARLDEAAASRRIVVIERDATARGADAAAIPFPRAAPAPVPPIYDGVIATVSRAGYQAYMLRMTDGSAWRISEAGDVPAAREPVRMTRGALGSYLARIGGRRAVRAAPVR